MFKRKFRLPSPALVISMITLSLVLGGTAFAASTATHKDKKADIKLIKKLAPSLSVKHAKTANSATSATTATNATNATNAATAANANALQGKAASAFAPSAIEAAHVVDTAGEPAFQNGWHLPGFPGDEGLSFYKDPWGVVHIQGSTANPGSSGTVFTLPAGYRPTKNLYFAVYGAGGSIAFVQVTDTGDVNPFGGSTTFLGLTNITFRAGL
jgi:hypothetical protein